jgi:glycosyltransferase involved in cell wall biosynthesis
MQDIGFLFRLLGDPALRRLGPREPALSCGAIATKPASRARSAARLKVLLVSPFLPYPLSHGGAVRIFNLCRELASRVDFILVAIREKHDFIDYEKLHEIFREVYTVDIDERPSRNDSLPAQVWGHQSHALRALIADLARIHQPDMLQFEYTHMAAFRDAAPEIPAILVEHDLTFTLYAQLASAKRDAAAQAEYQRWLAFEQHWLRAYEGVWTVSEEDRQTVIRETGRAPARTFSVPNGVDVHRFLPASEATAQPEVFYVGSFRHLPNILGFQALLNEVMPRVWARFPEARLRVVAGPQHTTYWKGPLPKDPRVEIHGFVEDLRPLYARAAVVAVPLEVSAGTNIKVLEAMACGKAVVTTAVGCAGLGLENSVDAIIRSNWDEFAAAACDLLEDPALRARIAVAARSTVERRFSWAAIADSALQSYTALTSAGVAV